MLQNACVMDYLPVNDRQHGANLLYVRVGHSEVVPVQHRKVGELAGFDRADLFFHAQEPAVAAGEHAKSLVASELLVAVDALSERIHASNGEVDMRPGIERSDVDAIAVHAHLNAMIDDRAEWRAHNGRAVRRHPSKRRHLNAAAQC